MNIPLTGAVPQGTASDSSASVPFESGKSTFGKMLERALEGATTAVANADSRAASVAAGSGDVAGASLARAKADVLLEIVSVTASRVSAALNALLQTQA